MALGLGLSNIQILGGDAAAAVIEDYMWETVALGELRPLALGTVSDFHDTWDLVTISSEAGHYQPGATPSADEGYWDIGASSDTDFIRPIDIS